MLKTYITDLIGNVLAKPKRIPAKGGGNQTQVTVPLCDSRTATTRVSLWDSTTMGVVKPLSRMLKVYWIPTPAHTPKLIFWGVILKPTYDFSEGTCTIQAHDQSIWAKKNYHRYGDIVVDKGYTIDGRGIRNLFLSALPLDSQIDRGVKHPGVLWGYDNTTRKPFPAKIEEPTVSEALAALATRGQNVYESITALSEQVYGPEWDFRPLDIDDQGTTAARGTPGYPEQARDSRPAVLGTNQWYAQLDTYVRKGTDKSATVKLQWGYGAENLSNVIIEPDGDQEKNYAVVVAPGGEEGRRDAKNRALEHDEMSWRDHGIYQTWVSSQSDDPLGVLKDKARAYVDAYNWAPVLTQVTVKKGSKARFFPFFDFEHGDEVTVGAKLADVKWHVKNVASREITGRVTNIILTEDAEGQVTPDLEIVPTIAATIGTGDEGG